MVFGFIFMPGFAPARRGTFVSAKVPRRAGTKPRFKINIRKKGE
jgi:hypothetical protein